MGFLDKLFGTNEKTKTQGIPVEEIAKRVSPTLSEDLPEIDFGDNEYGVEIENTIETPETEPTTEKTITEEKETHFAPENENLEQTEYGDPEIVLNLDETDDDDTLVFDTVEESTEPEPEDETLEYEIPADVTITTEEVNADLDVQSYGEQEMLDYALGDTNYEENVEFLQSDFSEEPIIDYNHDGYADIYDYSENEDANSEISTELLHIESEHTIFDEDIVTDGNPFLEESDTPSDYDIVNNLTASDYPDVETIDNTDEYDTVDEHEQTLADSDNYEKEWISLYSNEVIDNAIVGPKEEEKTRFFESIRLVN